MTDKECMKTNLFLVILSILSFSHLARTPYAFATEAASCTSCLPSRAGNNFKDLTAIVNKAQNISKKAATTKSTCIQLGGKSISGKYPSSISIYRSGNGSASDGYKVIYDGTDPKLVGAPSISKVEIDTSVECGDDFKGKVYGSDFSNPTSMNDLVTKSGPMKVFFPAGACPKQQIELRVLSQKCQNPTVPECSKMVVRETYKFSGHELYWLDAVDDTNGLPCQK